MTTNATIAERLQSRAAELARNGRGLYRVRAYRQAALEVLKLPEPVETILHRDGRAGLETLPGIGRSLAEALESLVERGEFPEKSDGCREAPAFGLMRVCSDTAAPSSN